MSEIKEYDLSAQLGCQAQLTKTKNKKKFPLKDSLWSAAVVMPMVCSFPPDIDFVKFALPSLMHVGLLVVIEAFIMEKISSVWEAEFDCTEEPIAFTAYLCIGCLCLYVLASDVCDAIVAFQWICQIPTCGFSDNRPIKFRTTQVTREETRDEVKVKITETVSCTPEFGMTMPFRIYAVLLMLVRIGLTGIVLVLGSGYILSSRSAEDQILASLTMVFLVELDDISYGLLQPDMVKNKLDDMPALIIPQEDDKGIMSYGGLIEPYWGYFSVALLLYVSSCMVQSWCNKEQVASAAGFGIPLALGFVSMLVVGVVVVCKKRQDDEQTKKRLSPASIVPGPKS